ncbi:low molecular weight protein-tyrosine-phosphatase [Peptostreptococcus porci]|uniref:low molecular weight protein-tyrosine-phosphatase n=2 Tax=Peptostreptococcus porci TaxID=2652282 RepID=UPI002A748FDC|nr:low molecular weight protein-tyrosine-phosphatase [Peptostreptococcus porci]MDY2795109.1 low molecular weight protein-tyrosine-phosphatase [Peptostreptococcus porci]MDY4560394.1 low molecular weight protein-tyrosine-phosphatase [Peptostreptococcus porci]MDY5436715.1 low molecular weight protein-tyrosine-phosphatase [Peptostreptococcus porci]MDY5479360.1 low molecular weight protein-tyrosine-phosphatase [Peptostreptococcus porci]MDY6232672.1 low molecular weight protein-tyrosine-phosphatase 
MKNIMFVCHGNICRSPMAEALFRDMLKKNNLQSKVFVDSSATSYEEIGNPVHNGTRKKLEEFNISVDGLFSTKLKKSDFDKFDYIFVMDNNNLNNIKREFGDYDSEKVMRLLDITNSPRDIADPWYTGDFDKTYNDIYEGCSVLLERIKSEL